MNDKEKIVLSITDILTYDIFDSVNLESQEVTISDDYIAKTQKLIYWITVSLAFLLTFLYIKAGRVNYIGIPVVIIGYIISCLYTKLQYKIIDETVFLISCNEEIHFWKEENYLYFSIDKKEDIDGKTYKTIRTDDLINEVLSYSALSGYGYVLNIETFLTFFNMIGNQLVEEIIPEGNDM